MSTSETRQRLSDYHSFLMLVWALKTDRGSVSDEVRTVLNSVTDFLRTATARDIRERANEIEALLNQIVKAHDKILPSKKGVREIARDFRLLTKTEPDVWRYGIPCGWLLERFDLSRLPQVEDLPVHARVGIGPNAGRVIVEEISLLQDVFFLLARARKSFEVMKRCADSQCIEHTSHESFGGYSGLSALNSSVCTYSRLGVLTAVAFVEAFVNSVGWNEVAIRANLSEDEKAVLQGTRKGRYLNLESKIERIPRIIRPDKESPIVISDEKQMREPFVSFLRETKAVRDASMHCAPGKAPILLPPMVWLSWRKRQRNMRLPLPVSSGLPAILTDSDPGISRAFTMRGSSRRQLTG